MTTVLTDSEGPQDSEKRLITVKAAAQILAMSRSAIYELMNSGRLTYCRLPGTGSRCSRRIPLNALREFIAKATVGPTR